MTDLRTAAQQALEALENGKRVRAGEGGTKYQPPLEDSAIAALRAALEQPEPMCVGCEGKPTLQNSPCAVCGKIAQQEQEPVARMHEDGSGRVINQRSYAEARRDGGASWSSVKNYTIPLYTHPPRREWQSLTEEERDTAIRWAVNQEDTHFSRTVARAIEQALRSKNHE